MPQSSHTGVGAPHATPSPHASAGSTEDRQRGEFRTRLVSNISVDLLSSDLFVRMAKQSVS
jgi:hypothetical protein